MMTIKRIYEFLMRPITKACAKHKAEIEQSWRERGLIR